MWFREAFAKLYFVLTSVISHCSKRKIKPNLCLFFSSYNFGRSSSIGFSRFINMILVIQNGSLILLLIRIGTLSG